MSLDREYTLGGRHGVLSRDQARGVFAQTMGLVALTVGCAALGAYIGRDLSGGATWLLFIGAIGCIIGLNVAARRDREQLAILMLFGLGLLIGMACGPLIAVYAKSDPAVLWQSAGATAAFVGGLGAYGYATRRDLSSWIRVLFWALLALILFGVLLIFINIPNGNLIYTILGLGIFAGFTVFDFNRLRRADAASSVMIAASIFLDIFNVFLFMLRIFGGGRS
jgi:FtsH-binding integral membrane protein